MPLSINILLGICQILLYAFSLPIIQARIYSFAFWNQKGSWCCRVRHLDLVLCPLQFCRWYLMTMKGHGSDLVPSSWLSQVNGKWLLGLSVCPCTHRTEQIITAESSKNQQELSPIIAKKWLLYSDLYIVEVDGNVMTNWLLINAAGNTTSYYFNVHTFLVSIATLRTIADPGTGCDH